MSIFNHFTERDLCVLAAMLLSVLAYLVGYYRGRHAELYAGDFTFSQATRELLDKQQCQISWLRTFVDSHQDD